MPRINPTPTRTYASEANVEAAIKARGFEHLRYMILWTEEVRYFPVFIGQDAVHEGVHFHFNVVA